MITPMFAITSLVVKIRVAFMCEPPCRWRAPSPHASDIGRERCKYDNCHQRRLGLAAHQDEMSHRTQCSRDDALISYDPPKDEMIVPQFYARAVLVFRSAAASLMLRFRAKRITPLSLESKNILNVFSRE